MAKQLFVKLQTPTIELKVEAKDASGITGAIKVGFKRYTIEELQKKFENPTKLENETDLDFLTKEIIYIKDATLEVYDNGVYVEDLVIKDSREAEPNEFFQEPKEALAVLLGYYLNSSPWKNALLKSYQEALFNTNFAEGELKN